MWLHHILLLRHKVEALLQASRTFPHIFSAIHFSAVCENMQK
jgi:hypothetical protein